MLRKTDSNNPADWLWYCAGDLELLAVAAEREVGYAAVRSKLAEVLEKLLKAELIRVGWPLVKTHDFAVFTSELSKRGSDLVATVTPLTTRLADDFMQGRYPGFDLDDEDWPTFRADLAEIQALYAIVHARVHTP